ncbi:MAG: hypothetical protein JSV72_03260 [Ralstonia sp.]|jgi:hypothetical protein|nr:MAG: hypothetical protein JSV72_03260 [Ralstonia sp.]
MYDFITPDLLALLFGLDADPPDEFRVTGPVAVVPDQVEAMGIVFGPVRFVVFFAAPLLLADGDPEFLAQVVDNWAGGHMPHPDARVVKFARAEADRQTMFNPEDWPLPQPQAIWQFIEVLSAALVAHAHQLPQVGQYFYIPQAGSLDTLYNRMARDFERGRHAVRFRCIIRPAQDEGGFYGYERA